MKTTCRFCHKEIPSAQHAQHVATHTERREDGQQRDHITLPQKGRYKGDLDGVPKVYRHAVCGVATGMPEEIIRTYLVKPDTYSPFSFCCGCKDYMPYDSFFWVETGQRLDHYFEELKQSVAPPAQKAQKAPEQSVLLKVLIVALTVVLAIAIKLLGWFF